MSMVAKVVPGFLHISYSYSRGYAALGPDISSGVPNRAQVRHLFRHSPVRSPSDHYTLLCGQSRAVA